MGIIIREGTYYAVVRINGRQVWRSAGKSERRAHEILADLLDRRERGTFDEEPIHRTTLAGFAPAYLKWANLRKRSAERDARSLKHLEKVFGEARMERISKADVYQYQEQRSAAHISGATINREVACLRKVLSLAVELGHIARNPLLGIRMLPESPARQPSLDDEDEARLLWALPRWMRPLVDVALATGARQGELLELHWRDINATAGCIVIADSKSGESRRVPLPRSLLAELDAARGASGDFALRLDEGREFGRNAVSAAFSKAAKKSGLRGMRFHDLRHVAASRWLANGGNLVEVAALLGQKTLSMAMRYSHANWNRLQGLVEGL
jgi:integrase